MREPSIIPHFITRRDSIFVFVLVRRHSSLSIVLSFLVAGQNFVMALLIDRRIESMNCSVGQYSVYTISIFTLSVIAGSFERRSQIGRQ